MNNYKYIEGKIEHATILLLLYPASSSSFIQGTKVIIAQQKITFNHFHPKTLKTTQSLFTFPYYAHILIQ